MITRSSAAPTGNFLPVSIVISLIVLVATLFVVVQTTNLPIFPANSTPYGTARAPIFRGLIHIPEFRWVPLFRSAAPDAASDETHMPASQLIDRWTPFIKEASVRFSIPEKWIRTIIQIESGGRTMLWGRPITSGAGAMGVMQLMHDTYNEMSVRNGLGSNPYDVHDNILAGTAYLRELYNRYGYPRLFAAYNAGPAAVEAHMRGAKLPAETRNYIRLALAGTSPPASTTKSSAHISAKLGPARVTRTSAKAPAKASAGKLTKIVAHRSAARPVHAAAAHHAAAPVRAAAAHHATRLTRIAAHVSARTTHAPVTHAAAHHRVKKA